MQAKSVGPTPPKALNQPPPGTPLPHPQLADIDHLHRIVASGTLVDALARIGKK